MAQRFQSAVWNSFAKSAWVLDKADGSIYNEGTANTDKLFASLRSKMADGWFDELLRSLFAPAPVQVLQVPTLPKKQEETQAPARTDAKLVLDHPLTVADLGEGAPSAAGQTEQVAGATVLRHPSAGSLYLNFYYDLGHVAPEDLPYLDLLTDVLDELDTPTHTAQQLNTLRSTWLGLSLIHTDAADEL